eukprot:TRINITY_DN61727_c0_g3_i1.p1 TRINITY_DN61727_c0_g3~~TRINITY_DN61727_c0_g3_i1.p1  ORF type:complete len:728 (+),score=-17.06 TRINITY_DN61727_c0_g3_i1:184-2367(+)
MLELIINLLLLCYFNDIVNGECPNGCNGHGKCMAYDMCYCQRNWQGNDCSERVCAFGRAHVDSPKGDLDMSSTITDPYIQVVENDNVYPFGTTEMYPRFEDTDLTPLKNTAHDYMECSNKGSCNRETGECECFDGYDGVACQRASCPGYPVSCSGHGVCKSAKQLAFANYGNEYKLWDQDISMGCECDPGYSGSDCSDRLCKYGVDPLYEDDVLSAKVGLYDFAILTTGTNFTSAAADKSGGTWSIRFFDYHGEDWLTRAIPVWATCDEVIAALEDLPANVIPKNTMECFSTTHNTNLNSLLWNNSYLNTNGGLYNHMYYLHYRIASWVHLQNPELIKVPQSWVIGNSTHSSASLNNNLNLAPKFRGNIYRLKFKGTPGGLKEPQIELYTDGKKPTLTTNNDGTVVTYVVSDGQQGESIDHVADHCDGVTVQVQTTTINPYSTSTTDYSILTDLDATELIKLKKCLGDADDDSSNNVEVYNWDYGSAEYPHLIKLVRTQSSFLDGPYYAAIMWDSSINAFKLLNPFIAMDEIELDVFDVYTTKGTLAQTASTASALFGYGSRKVITTVSGYQSQDDGNGVYDGNVACESNLDTANVPNCLAYSDLFTLLDPTHPAANPPYINLYRAARVWTGPNKFNISDYIGGSDSAEAPLSRGIHMIETDSTINWGADDEFYNFNVYRFRPSAQSSYTYFNECSNRGVCDAETGVCNCFSTYNGDNCNVLEGLMI